MRAGSIAKSQGTHYCLAEHANDLTTPLGKREIRYDIRGIHVAQNDFLGVSDFQQLVSHELFFLKQRFGRLDVFLERRYQMCQTNIK